MVFRKHDRVQWSFEKPLNHKSSTTITKRGVYYGKVRHTYRYNGPQLAIVQFDGNKRVSKVPYYELEPEK